MHIRANTCVALQADDRFFWNRHLQHRLIDLAQTGNLQSDISGFVIPVIFGCRYILVIAIVSAELTAVTFVCQSVPSGLQASMPASSSLVLSLAERDIVLVHDTSLEESTKRAMCQTSTRPNSS